MSVITKATLDIQVADILRQRIIDGGLQAGERLTEIKLSEEFDLSRGTIRAALRLLLSEKLLIQMPYRGWEVAALTSDDAYELQTLRSPMDSLAARLAAERLTPSDRRSLSHAFQRLERACEANDRSAAARSDFELHKTIVDISGHRRLVQFYEIIAGHIQRYIFRCISSSDALLRSDAELVDQHRPIVEAIFAKDGERAAGEACSHNDSEGKRLVDYMASIEAATG